MKFRVKNFYEETILKEFDSFISAIYYCETSNCWGHVVVFRNGCCEFTVVPSSTYNYNKPMTTIIENTETGRKATVDCVPFDAIMALANAGLFE